MALHAEDLKFPTSQVLWQLALYGFSLGATLIAGLFLRIETPVQILALGILVVLPLIISFLILTRIFPRLEEPKIVPWRVASFKAFFVTRLVLGPIVSVLTLLMLMAPTSIFCSGYWCWTTALVVVNATSSLADYICFCHKMTDLSRIKEIDKWHGGHRREDADYPIPREIPAHAADQMHRSDHNAL